MAGTKTDPTPDPCIVANMCAGRIGFGWPVYRHTCISDSHLSLMTCTYVAIFRFFQWAVSAGGDLIFSGGGDFFQRG